MSASHVSVEDLRSMLLPARLILEADIPQDLPSPRLLFEAVNRYEAIPFDRVLLGAGQDTKRVWLNGCLEHVDFKNKCFLFVIQYGWRWYEIEAANPEEWILNLLLKSNVDDFMILSQDVTGFLGFIEDEAKYLAFLSKHIR